MAGRGRGRGLWRTRNGELVGPWYHENKQEQTEKPGRSPFLKTSTGRDEEESKPHSTGKPEISGVRGRGRALWRTGAGELVGPGYKHNKEEQIQKSGRSCATRTSVSRDEEEKADPAGKPEISGVDEPQHWKFYYVHIGLGGKEHEELLPMRCSSVHYDSETGTPVLNMYETEEPLPYEGINFGRCLDDQKNLNSFMEEQRALYPPEKARTPAPIELELWGHSIEEEVKKRMVKLPLGFDWEKSREQLEKMTRKLKNESWHDFINRRKKNLWIWNTFGFAVPAPWTVPELTFMAYDKFAPGTKITVAYLVRTKPFLFGVFGYHGTDLKALKKHLDVDELRVDVVVSDTFQSDYQLLWITDKVETVRLTLQHIRCSVLYHYRKQVGSIPLPTSDQGLNLQVFPDIVMHADEDFNGLAKTIPRCFYCKKAGSHISNDCKVRHYEDGRKRQERDKLLGKLCNKCGMPGHEDITCPEKEFERCQVDIKAEMRKQAGTVAFPSLTKDVREGYVSMIGSQQYRTMGEEEKQRMKILYSKTEEILGPLQQGGSK